MNIMNLQILNAYRNSADFSDISVDDFQQYATETYVYPIGALIGPISMYTNIKDTPNEYKKDLKYFTSTVQYLYTNIYTEEEQRIIAHYFALFCYTKLNVSDDILVDIEEILKLPTIHKEIQELLKILKYNYAEALILQSSPKKNKIQELLQELLDDPPIFAINDLLQFK